MKLRHIISTSRAGGPTLVAEIELSETWIRQIRTRILLDMDITEEFLTRIYWYHGEGTKTCTHPPAPVHINCVDTFRGTPLMEDLANQVNQRIYIKWAFSKRK